MGWGWGQLEWGRIFSPFSSLVNPNNGQKVSSVDDMHIILWLSAVTYEVKCRLK